MVIRLVSVTDQMELTEFHEAFRAILGWSGNLDYILRVHGQEFNSFRRITRSKALREFSTASTAGSGHNAADFYANVLHAMSTPALTDRQIIASVRDHVSPQER